MPAKKTLPSMMAANVGKNPPFVPVVFAAGPPTLAPQKHVGLWAKEFDYAYAGQNQTSTINVRIPKPV